MGVIGLWSILDAGARPVRLESLAKKRLAVDASIWIYQFLKAVRDKEGNVLRNAHVVGFFRRICKLLFHGIKPVFVFDGKAPLLKKQTLRNRKVLREGGRVDVARTAGKILAVQMRKRAIEEKQRQDQSSSNVLEESVPEDPVYFNEIELKPDESMASRFKKGDQYHLPDMAVDLDRAGSINDPRIMTHEELQAYAKDYEGGEDMNLYDFSKIDYDSEMFTSLPLADQYSILNAARLRSRLRMGLSVEQLTDMFPDRMAFSRFQVERVKERSDLTNRLMNLNGMNEVGTQRIASERGREYVLVKNDTVDGGWSLGLVNNAENPIVIDKGLLDAPEDDEDEDLVFEDVPIAEGLETSTAEEDAIKFAIEESRRAQLSNTRPEPSFRPTKRKAAGHQKPKLASRGQPLDVPLFSRTDTEEENARQMNNASPLNITTSSESASDTDMLTTGDNSDEATQLRKAIDLSLERPLDPSISNSNAGGFVLEDEDEDDIIDNDLAVVVGGPEDADAKHDGALKPSTNSGVHAQLSRFELPFPKLDFHKSTLAQVPNPVVNPDSTPLELLRNAMSKVAQPEESTEVLPVTEEIRRPADSLTKQPTAKPVPSWFQSEVETRTDSPKPKDSSPTEVLNDSILDHGTTEIDLTTMEDGIETDGGIIREQSPDQKSTNQKLGQIFDSTKSEPQIIVDSSDDEGNTALPVSLDGWDDVSSKEQSAKNSEEAERTSAPDHSLKKESTLEVQANIERVKPSIQHEDSILDEVDQQRMMEEEDMMTRMAAEEDEYARFSSELGNRTVNNYTNEEYEQDLKALKNQQRKNLRDADEVTQVMVLECQELLAQFGIPYIIAASEAESQCARLVQLNLVDGIVTDDSDVFLFGGTRVYRNMFNAAKTVECYILSDLEREFDLDRDKLIRLAYLLGSDYTEGIKKIGPVLAIELIAEFSGPEGLKNFSDYVDRVQSGRENEEDKSSAFRKKFRKVAEKLVLPDNFPNPLVAQAYTNPEVDNDDKTFEWGTPDVDGLRTYLMKQCRWQQEYTDSQLLPVIKDMNMKQREGTQRNLTQFFAGSVGAGGAPGVKKHVKSNRMHNALSSLKGEPKGRKRTEMAAPTDAPLQSPRKRKAARVAATTED